MDCSYSNDMINSATGTMKTEHWVTFFSVIRSWHNIGGFIRVGVAGSEREIIFLMIS